MSAETPESFIPIVIRNGTTVAKMQRVPNQKNLKSGSGAISELQLAVATATEAKSVSQSRGLWPGNKPRNICTPA